MEISWCSHISTSPEPLRAPEPRAGGFSARPAEVGDVPCWILQASGLNCFLCKYSQGGSFLSNSLGRGQLPSPLQHNQSRPFPSDCGWIPGAVENPPQCWWLPLPKPSTGANHGAVRTEQFVAGLICFKITKQHSTTPQEWL